MAEVPAGTRRLNIGPGGESGRSKELVRICVLAAVIVIAVVVVVFFSWSDDSSPKDEGVKAMAQCLDCKTEFEIDPFAAAPPDPDSRNVWRVTRFTCTNPDCLKKNRSLQMTQCPDKENCGKFFLAGDTLREYEDEWALHSGRKPRVLKTIPPVTCPHCGIEDIHKFMRDQKKKNR